MSVQHIVNEPTAATVDTGKRLALSVVIPCLNEADNIERCVSEALHVMEQHDIFGEVVVADNASDDDSAALAEAAGARVVHEPRRGYGNAYLAGFQAARGRYIVMLDADLTYPFEEIPHFLELLEQGADLVMGDRMDNIEPGAMPWLHRYVGNPVLSGILNAFFRTGIRDAHCGMRAFRRDVLPRLDLRMPGMEFASEMVIRASKAGLDIREVPIAYRPRGGESKLSTFRDGWRHLRFLLIHSPTHLVLIPGALLAAVGAFVMLAVLSGLELFGREWHQHTQLAGALMVVIGVQVVSMGICAHAYGMYFLNDKDAWFDAARRRFRLEHGLLLGGTIALVGLAIAIGIVITWAQRGFGGISDEELATFAATLIIVGVQIFFSSFLLSILGLRRRH